jgi:hypothetical protein
MIYSLVYLLSVIRGSIFMLLCLSLYALILLLSGISGITFSSPQYLVIYCMAFSIPLSGWIASLIVEKNISTLYNRRFISTTVFTVTAALCLQNGKSIDYILAAFNAVQNKSPMELVGLFVNTVNAALKCSAVVACSFIILISLVEIPFVWFCSAFGFTHKAEISFAGLRPAVFFVILIYSFDLITGFLSHRLWPAGF